jgi:hypothetical protein
MLGRTRVDVLGWCSGLATTASWWRPRDGSGRRGEGRELQRVGSWVQKLVGAPREAEANWDLAGGVPARRAGGARHRRRERAEREAGEEDRDLNAISKISRTYLKNMDNY